MIFQKPLYMEVSKVFKSLLATLDTPSYTNIQKKTGRNMGKWLDLLESETSDKTEKGYQAEVSKVSKAQESTFRHFDAGGISKNNSEAAKRYAYRFRLHEGEGGGVVLTDEPDLDKARDSLAELYGDRLAIVVKA